MDLLGCQIHFWLFSLFFFGSHLHMYMNRLVQYIYACGSVLGMYLFGGKFCMRDDGSGSCTCEEILRHDPGCICDRKHFNTLLWATVTVFQASSWRTRTTKFRHTPQHELFDTQNRRFDPSISVEFHVLVHHSIAHLIIYSCSFESKSIWL